MINRNVNVDDLRHFDWFNDYRDTFDWLHACKREDDAAKLQAAREKTHRCTCCHHYGQDAALISIRVVGSATLYKKADYVCRACRIKLKGSWKYA